MQQTADHRARAAATAAAQAADLPPPVFVDRRLLAHQDAAAPAALGAAPVGVAAAAPLVVGGAFRRPRSLSVPPAPTRVTHQEAAATPLRAPLRAPPGFPAIDTPAWRVAPEEESADSPRAASAQPVSIQYHVAL